MPPNDDDGRWPPLSAQAKKCEADKKVPFTSEELLEGDPKLQLADFRQPLLRICPFAQDRIVWEEKLGQGYDGVAWKVGIDGTSYVIKVFWDDIAPEYFAYWAPQRECRNAALLQMIKASIKSADEPIYLRPDPATRRQAVLNLICFSEEGRRDKPFAKRPQKVSMSSAPRTRECFGWMKVPGQELNALGPDLRPRSLKMNKRWRTISSEKEYYAIVYEYIPDSLPPLDDESTQAVLDFFWLTGFSFIELRRENWISGILLDMADLGCPVTMAWSSGAYERVNIRNCGENFFQGVAATKKTENEKAS